MPDRLPPYSAESESAVLGCIMLDWQSAIPTCIEFFREPEVFYDLRHQIIFKTMLELYEDNIPIDSITLTERLKLWDLLDQVGGLSYVAALPDGVPSAANLTYYAETVREKYLLRRMIRACTEGVSAIYDREDSDVEKLLDEIERDILRVSESRVIEATDTIIRLVDQALTEFDTLQSKQGALTGLETGFVDFDRLTNGMQPGEMYVLAARPSVGKTSLAMNIAENVAVNNGLPVGIFSVEMTARSLTERLICSRARVSMTKVRKGVTTDEDRTALVTAAKKIRKSPLFIDDTSGLSILQLRAKARRMWQKYGCKLFVIDYLQLLNAMGGKRKVENRQQEVADISTGIKSLAKELNVPILVLSQLNRDVEKDKKRKPRLSDLRESGAIEQDADLVAFMYRIVSKLQGDEEMDDSPGEAVQQIILAVAKQRNGPTGECPLVFFRKWTRFETGEIVGTKKTVRSKAPPVVPEPQQNFPVTNDP